MDELKNSLKENRVIIIISILIVLLAIGYSVYNTFKPDGTKEKDLSTITEDIYVKNNYEVNEYRVINISELDLLNAYLKDYLKKIVNDKEAAWNLLSEESKNKFNNDINEYKKYLDKNISINTINNEVVEYRKNNSLNYQYDIIDSEENKYIITESSTWNFKITLNGKK